MIEVFKTNIGQPAQAAAIVHLLQPHFPGSRINIDLHDCDKVLRVEGPPFLPSAVLELVKENGFMCSLLE